MHIFVNILKEHLYQFSRAAITKYHRMNELNNRNVLSHSLEAISSQTRCWQDWSPPRPLSLAGRWPPSCCFFLIWSSFCASALLVSLLFYKDTSHIELGSYPNGLILNYCLFEDLISKYGYILRSCKLGLQHINFEGT